MFEFTVLSGRRGWTLDSGGFPKIRPCRWRNAEPSPPAYVSARKGTGKQGLGGLDPGWTPEASPRYPPRDQRQSVRAHDPEYIAIEIVSGAIRLVVRCLKGNCLTRPSSLDRLSSTRAPRRTPSTSSAAPASRSVSIRSLRYRTASAGSRWRG